MSINKDYSMPLVNTEDYNIVTRNSTHVLYVVHGELLAATKLCLVATTTCLVYSETGNSIIVLRCSV